MCLVPVGVKSMITLRFSWIIESPDSFTKVAEKGFVENTKSDIWIEGLCEKQTVGRGGRQIWQFHSMNVLWSL